jgi:nitrite reductase (cytochrome c-552)
MSEPAAASPAPPPPAPTARRRRFVYIAVAFGSAVATVLVLLLLVNIMERKGEAKQHVFRVVDLTEETVDPAEWGRNYPRQYDSYRRTVDIERTRHGGSDAFQKLDTEPVWRELFKGYAFGVDYREERGHAFMLSDQDTTERVKQFKQPGACLHCHASVIPAYRQAGGGDVMKGFEIVCAMPYSQARGLVAHPVTCLDCHHPETLALRVTRPAFLIGLRELARTDADLPHLPSVMRWRREGRRGDFDPNAMASRQEMRSLVCSQCHVEYHFRGEGKRLTYPWNRGLKVEQIESYYDEAGFTDWTHTTSGAPLLKAQHPEFELWSQGIHARSGVACADCHMPYKREGAVKISDHHVRSPLLSISRSCQTCHRYPEEEIRARAEAIQERTQALKGRAEQAVLALIQAIDGAKRGGATDDELKQPRALHRKAQWRLDFVAAENSLGFHAPAEAARILAEAIDYARQGEVATVRRK